LGHSVDVVTVVVDSRGVYIIHPTVIRAERYWREWRPIALFVNNVNELFMDVGPIWVGFGVIYWSDMAHVAFTQFTTGRQDVTRVSSAIDGCLEKKLDRLSDCKVSAVSPQELQEAELTLR